MGRFLVKRGINLGAGGDLEHEGTSSTAGHASKRREIFDGNRGLAHHVRRGRAICSEKKGTSWVGSGGGEGKEEQSHRPCATYRQVTCSRGSWGARTGKGSLKTSFLREGLILQVGGLTFHERNQGRPGPSQGSRALIGWVRGKTQWHRGGRARVLQCHSSAFELATERGGLPKTSSEPTRRK